MRLLLDTHLLLWAADEWERLSATAAELIGDTANDLYFSAASVWELAIKHARRPIGVTANPHIVRRGLLDSGYVEVPVTSDHSLAVLGLPALHKDPFDRLLLAQAMVEGLLLLTADAMLARYPGPVRGVLRTR